MDFREKGSSLLFTMIVLVSMLFGTVSLYKNTNILALVSGNIAFKQSSVAASDIAINVIMERLKGPVIYFPDECFDSKGVNGGIGVGTGRFYKTQRDSEWDSFNHVNGIVKHKGRYDTNVNPTCAPPSNGDEDEYKWGSPIKVGQNNVYYIIDRLCKKDPYGDPTDDCLTEKSYSPDSHSVGASIDQGVSYAIYHRVTIRILGPNKTESYVQLSIPISQ